MLYDGESVREVLYGVLLICMERRFAICSVDWCRLAAKEKGEPFDSPFFFIYMIYYTYFGSSYTKLFSDYSVGSVSVIS